MNRGERVSVEAELKARVGNHGRVRSQLDQRASPDASTYTDRYFDYPDRRLSKAGEELRVRTIIGTDGRPRAVLTYKELRWTRTADPNPSTRQLWVTPR